MEQSRSERAPAGWSPRRASATTTRSSARSRCARRAAQAGAWAIKFQLYKADELAVPGSPKYWSDAFGTDSQYEAFQLSDHLDYGAYAEVAAACRELGIVFFATPFDLRAIEALEEIGVPALQGRERRYHRSSAA